MDFSVARQNNMDVLALDDNNYLVSLLEEAVRVELMSHQELDDIQAQLMELLKKVIMRYNGGDSSSVRVETAQNLLTSILFSIDAYCIQAGQPEACLAAIQKTPVSRLFELGQEKLKQYLADSRLLWEENRNSRVNTSLIAYNSTLDEALPDFFRQYDLAFFAYDIPCAIDYPLAQEILTARGVVYIKRYMERIKLENQFCQHFQESQIAGLLGDYGRTCRIDYTEYLLNVFELVVNNAIFASLLDKPATCLAVSRNELETWQKRLENLDSAALELYVHLATVQLASSLGIHDQDLLDYLKQYEALFSRRLLNALQQKQLERLIITETRPLKPGPISFTSGVNMEDEDLRMLVDQLLDCQEAGQKCAMLLSSVGSPEDFVAILESDCFFEDEYAKLFEAMGDMELALIAGMLVSSERWEDDSTLIGILEEMELPDDNWKSEMAAYLKVCHHSRQVRIGELVRDMLAQEYIPGRNV